MSQSNQTDTLLDILSRTERLPKHLLDAYQNRSLEIMLRHAHNNTDFYRDRLACLFDEMGNVNLNALHDVPILTRSEIQATPEQLHAEDVPENSGTKCNSYTSGSTGEPLKMRYSSINGEIARAIQLRTYGWNDIDFNGTLAAISTQETLAEAIQFGALESRWNALGTGELLFLNLKGSTVSDQLEWLASHKAKYLRSFPTVCGTLLQEADRQGIRFNLEKVLTVGELIPDLMREAKPDHWPDVIDSYATTETGPICSQCSHGTYHIHRENVFLEILDDDGSPTAPGEIGHVVVTALYNFAMPFIRYAIGDFAVPGDDQCACGSSLPTVQRIVGRQRNYFRFPGGRDVWPFAKSRKMRKYVPNRFRQIAQVSDYGIEFRYTPEAEDQSEDPAGLQAYLAECLDPNIQLKLVRIPIPVRIHGQKHLEYICELAQSITAPT